MAGTVGGGVIRGGRQVQGGGFLEVGTCEQSLEGWVSLWPAEMERGI